MSGQPELVRGHVLTVRLIRSADSFHGDAPTLVSKSAKYRGWSVSMDIGPVSATTIRMVGIFDVGRNVRLDNLFGRADYVPGMTPEQYSEAVDDKIEAAASAYELPAEWTKSDSLYTTIIASHAVTFPGSLEAAPRHYWASDDWARTLTAKFASQAEAAVGFVVARMMLGPPRISGPEYAQVPRLYLTVPGREPSPLTVVSGSGSLTVGREWGSVMDDLRVRPLEVDSKISNDVIEPIARIGQWHLHAYGEADQFRRFMWCYIGLEIIVDSIASTGRDALKERLATQSSLGSLVVSELLWPPAVRDGDPNRSIRFRFALTAALLSPETAADDVAEFGKINDFRNGIHGRLLISSSPPGGAFNLFERYSILAIEYLARVPD